MDTLAYWVKIFILALALLAVVLIAVEFLFARRRKQK
jgi:hypothetical protein